MGAAAAAATAATHSGSSDSARLATTSDSLRAEETRQTLCEVCVVLTDVHRVEQAQYRARLSCARRTLDETHSRPLTCACCLTVGAAAAVVSLHNSADGGDLRGVVCSVEVQQEAISQPRVGPQQRVGAGAATADTGAAGVASPPPGSFSFSRAPPPSLLPSLLPSSNNGTHERTRVQLVQSEELAPRTGQRGHDAEVVRTNSGDLALA